MPHATKRARPGAQGEQGVAGETGGKGDKGDKGDKGTANVIYSDWITIKATDNRWVGIGQNKIGIEQYDHNITQSVWDHGIFLIYIKYPGEPNFEHLLPTTIDFSSYSISYSNGLSSSGIITIRAKKSSGIFSSGIAVTFRYIIIPGGIHEQARTSFPPPDYSDYRAVCKYYGIPE